MTDSNLVELNRIPSGLLDAETSDLRTLLAGPTIIHLPGKQAAPLFISVLLHGNEPTGFMAVQSLLKKYTECELPRAMSLFIGNVAAAERQLRRLDGQPDFNRIWPGTEHEACPETEMAQAVTEIMRRRQVFASVDLHNNTGLNPHYACINRLDKRYLQLASLFGRLVVYFTHPKGVQSAAFAQFCPAVTLECGRPGQQHGIDHALEFLESCLRLNEFPEQPVHPCDIDLFHTVAQVKVADKVNFSFHEIEADLLLNDDIERMNFTEINPGTVLGTTRGGIGIPLIAEDAKGNNVTETFFRLRNSDLQIIRPAMPSMLTLDERVIRQDCLCYLMERIQYNANDLTMA